MAVFDVSRSDWGAAANTWDQQGYTDNTIDPITRVGITWHYNGPALGLESKDHSACLQAMKDIQAYHQKNNGWADIGYNFAICPHGYAFEGRGLPYKGAHSPSWNASDWGVILLLGTGEQVSAKASARAKSLAQALRDVVGKELVHRIHRTDPKASTECPGDVVASLVTSNAFLPTPIPPAPVTPPATTLDDVLKAVQALTTSVTQLVSLYQTEASTVEGLKRALSNVSSTLNDISNDVAEVLKQSTEGDTNVVNVFNAFQTDLDDRLDFIEQSITALPKIDAIETVVKNTLNSAEAVLKIGFNAS